MKQTVEGQDRSSIQTRRGPFWVHVILAALVVATYGYVVHCDFISLDDSGYVYANPLVMDGLTWGRVGEAFTTFLGSLWIPFTWISFMLDVSLFGMNQAAFHAENVLWHGASTLLLFHLLSKSTGRIWPSAVVAALFGVHPINVESVAWVTERKNVLCAFFALLSLNSFTSHARGAGRRSYWMAVAFHALALMAKPMAVVLPGMLLLWDIWPLGRRLQDWRRLLVEKVPFIILSGAACLLALRAPVGNHAWVTGVTLPWDSRISNALVSYGAYLRDFVWPAHLSAFYPHPIHVQALLAGISLMLIVVLSVIAVRRYRTEPYLLVGWLWFLGALVPMLGLIQVGSQARGDRFTYLAQIGIFFALVWWISDRLPKDRRTLAGWISGLVVLAFAGHSAAEVRYWTNTITLFERAIEQTGPNAFARVFAGRARMKAGQLSEAAEHLEIAVLIQPHLTSVWFDLGVVLMQLGRLEHAAQALAVAVAQDPASKEYRAELIRVREALRTQRVPLGGS